jgi:hypothetical protein
MDAITAAVAAGALQANRDSQADDAAADAAARWEEMRAGWKALNAAAGGGGGTRWGDRRTLKRKKNDASAGNAANLQDAIDAVGLCKLNPAA